MPERIQTYLFWRSRSCVHVNLLIAIFNDTYTNPWGHTHQNLHTEALQHQRTSSHYSNKSQNAPVKQVFWVWMDRWSGGETGRCCGRRSRGELRPLKQNPTVFASHSGENPTCVRNSGQWLPPPQVMFCQQAAASSPPFLTSCSSLSLWVFCH